VHQLGKLWLLFIVLDSVKAGLDVSLAERKYQHKMNKIGPFLSGSKKAMQQRTGVVHDSFLVDDVTMENLSKGLDSFLIPA
jgi:hypothetical protein